MLIAKRIAIALAVIALLAGGWLLVRRYDPAPPQICLDGSCHDANN
ncbi:MAG TPA: hypothetical protein VHE37_10015 [Nevskiaceae bacterium]|nr:hypothetical protein [Nevskiaceae bacterium]